MKAIVVGGGIMGLATAWALAREGHAVELFEQGPLPNPLASSMDEHRLIRTANMHLPGRQVDPGRVRRDLWRLAQWERERSAASS